ncbi:MAG: flagellar M-ring protein FliF C-terminal domain-containing protein [Candidatus Gastranaerophilales bacterium]|nr:flagellar M-ring protein FliF C-terminal domain-containing protein [Candidatus Gastranaerophilales bacterium]
MDFQKILENKPLLYGIIGVIVAVLALSITIGIVSSVRSPQVKNKAVNEKVIKEKLPLLTTDNIGKAIEIQALLAREGINAYREDDGTAKNKLYLKEYTQTQRDMALLTIVKSGLMDENSGLEIFDKGDFTSTKEDKRIRLVRAINGELARLIRKMGNIDDASVFISIPEQTMFTSMQKPVTATVQVTIAEGVKLDRMQVKAITNLLLGSVSGLEADNISITDTNGNVYSSILNSGDDMTAKAEENDKYMQQKVNAQLNKLIGKGNYIATVSTFLRQSPLETTSIDYNPNRKTSITEQTFNEGLGDRSQDIDDGGAVSVYLPSGLPQTGNGRSSQNRSYERTARETEYGVSKTHTSEYIKPGGIEDVSVAVTINKNALPPDTTLEELKDLIAGAAGPKVKSENVTIALADSLDPYLASDKASNLPKPAESGNPWWLAIAMIILGLGGGLKYISGKVKAAQERQREELAMLQEKTFEQERQLRDVNLKAAELIEKQAQMAQGLIEQQQREVVNPSYDLNNTINDLKSDLEGIDEYEAGEKIKNWIEKG